ncbi:MAG: MBL fold metallo-hydrolase RNA specificity domain-containing protein [Verrucomicrobiota bacterium]|jgi:metallo-beta-lactamase family protein|nr:MBL fold metallo-hydrolase [Verrucomicrobiota bacterium]
MKIEITFLGAARNVTGSCYLVQTPKANIVVDCGMYQEYKFKSRNWKEFPIPPNSIDAVLLTHAHLDHCGLLPKLVKDGFKGDIFCTPATAEIAGIIMADSAHIQEEDIKFKKKRHEREGRTGPFPYEPLYTQEDVMATIPLIRQVAYNQEIPIADGIHAFFNEVGHIFGSSFIQVIVKDQGDCRALLFSGDIGRDNLPIQRDPEQPEEADYVIMESTYGDRIHEEPASIPDELERVINSTYKAGGNIVIPAFAVERTQEILYFLGQLRKEKRIPPIVTFVDSPMAIRVIEVFRRHPELFDSETREMIANGGRPTDFPNLHLTRSVDESKEINNIRGTAIIIAGSGMCTGGRIKHHLLANISREESTILFVGYQAEGTLGRLILDQEHDEVRILGRTVPVRAKIERIGGFSAHADRNELIQWVTALEENPKKVFITHGEESVAMSFADHLEEKTGWSTIVPEYGQTITLD